MTITSPTLHTAARDLLLLSAEAGWHTRISFGEDTGGSPFVSVQGANANPDLPAQFYVTWHTRKTGTYRLFTCMAGTSRARLADRSLKHVKSLIQDTAHGAEEGTS